MITHRFTFVILFLLAERVSVFYMLMKNTLFPSHFLHFLTFWQATANPRGGRSRRLASALPQFHTEDGWK